MRLCFMEAAAYLKYFDEISDSGTKGYILRSRANVSLGQFKSPSEKIRLVKYTLQILQDKWYQEKAPELPWSRFIYMTHLQMAASISRSREKAMTPEDIAAAETAIEPVVSLQAETGTDGLTLEGMLTTGNEEEGMVERLTLQTALAGLPDRERQVLLLRYYRGMTQMDTARVLGVSQVQVSRLEKRAIDKLRRDME